MCNLFVEWENYCVWYGDQYHENFDAMSADNAAAYVYMDACNSDDICNWVNSYDGLDD